MQMYEIRNNVIKIQNKIRLHSDFDIIFFFFLDTCAFKMCSLKL